MPLISVITPASRGIKELTSLTRDFKNQTFKDFEHLIIYDGTVPTNVTEFMQQKSQEYNIHFTSIKKDPGNMKIAPGTKPRNHGLSLATGKYVVFCDDDDRYKDTYLETLITGMNDSTIVVTQMSCSDARIFKNGDPNNIKLVPEIGMPFPVICHVGTPCFILPKQWAIDNPWRDEPEHDYRFIKRIVDKYNPSILIKYGMQVDVDGLIIKGLIDWVSIPPFNRF